MKKVSLLIYASVIALLVALLVGVFLQYKDNIAEAFGNDTIDFTATKVKDKELDYSGSNQVYTNNNITLWCEDSAKVYAINYKDDDGNEVDHSFDAVDGTTFKHLIATTSPNKYWNLTNRTDEKKQIDVYFTISDGKILTGDSINGQKFGEIQAFESSTFHVFDIDGNIIELTGECESQERLLGQPYKVSFYLNAKSSCVLKSSSNRLVLFGINCVK